MVNAGLVANGVAGMVLNISIFLVNLAFGVYGIVLYNKLDSSNQFDDVSQSGQCLASTSLKLLLSVGILELVSAGFYVLGACGQCIKVFKACFGDEESASKTVEGMKTCATTIIGVAIFGMCIAMSVYVWRDQCNVLNSGPGNKYFFIMMQTYLIIHWTVPFAAGICVSCLSCCIGLCAGGTTEVFANSRNYDRLIN
jgi:hypothetical protein